MYSFLGLKRIQAKKKNGKLLKMTNQNIHNMYVKAIPWEHFEELRGCCNEEFVCLSRTYILKNEIFVKRLNKMTIKAGSQNMEMYVKIVCLGLSEEEVWVSPSLYYELSLNSLIDDVELETKAIEQSRKDIITTGLKLQRCLNQNHIKLENRNVIDQKLIELLKGEYANSYFRNGMFIPIIAFGSIVWFRVVSDIKLPFKLAHTDECTIDNKIFEHPFALGYAQYPNWHFYYSPKVKKFEYGINWPAYEQISSLFLKEKSKKGLLLYSDTNGESVGLFGKEHMIRTFADCNGFSIIQIDIIDICIDNEDMKSRYMKLRAMTDIYTEIFDQRLEPNYSNKIIFLFKNVHLLFPKDHEYDPIDLRIYSLFQSLLVKFDLVFTSNSLEMTSMDCIRSLCVCESYFDLLNEEQRYDILKQSDFLAYIQTKSNSIDPLFLESIAKITNTFTPYMLMKLIANCKIQSLHTETSIKAQIEKMKKIKANKAGAPTVPKVLWDDIGGLQNVKQEIIKTLNPTDSFEKKVLKRSGLLLFGVPGSGKTLLAKAIATNFSMNFFSVKGPELLDMYIGESESNIRKIFKKAFDNKPCVLFFDELDSIASKNNSSNMDRVVAQTLNEIDRVNQSGDLNVFVVGATNRPDLIDDSFTRPGRFDKMIYLGVIEDMNEKINLLKTLTRKYTMDFAWENVHTFINEKVPNNLTGADYQNLVNQVYNHVVEERIKELEKKHADIDKTEWNDKFTDADWFGNESCVLTININHFEYVLKSFRSSISASEIKKYEALRDKYCD